MNAALDPPARAAFLAAADAFVDLVARIPADGWDRPGLGDWDLRALVGHTGRAMTTVVDYLAEAGDIDPPDLADAAAYFAAAAELGDRAGLRESIRRRGVEAGEDLGDVPPRAVNAWRDAVVAALAAHPGDPVVPTRVGTMRLSAYLPTRTFELTAHGLDIAAALGLPPTWPDAALRTSVEIAAASAVLAGQGAQVLRALTGRTHLPDGFSVVP